MNAKIVVKRGQFNCLQRLSINARFNKVTKNNKKN